MANFQFGQQNVGSNWDVPSWYVQSMGQSPMAASIAGIGNSIAAFASGYQAAKKAERDYGMEQARLGLSERQVGLQESESLQRKKLIEQQAAEAEMEKRRQERLRLRQLELRGVFSGEVDTQTPSDSGQQGDGSSLPLIPFYLHPPSR